MKKIDFEVKIDQIERDLKKLYKIIRPKFEDIKIIELNGGVSNLMFKLDDSINKKSIVIRVFRPNKKFFDCGIEVATILKASELKITANLLGVFDNGMILDYLDAFMNSVQSYDQEIAKLTAQKLAKLHTIDMNGIANHRPLIFKWLDRQSEPLYDKKTFLDQRMEESDFVEFNTILPSYSKIEKLTEQLHEMVLERDCYGPITFCHNDLNLTNLLIERKTRDVFFIDFEWVIIINKFYFIISKLMIN